MEVNTIFLNLNAIGTFFAGVAAISVALDIHFKKNI